jgi:hypothetical protein
MPAQQMSAQDINSLAKMLIQQKGVRMQQQIYSRVVDPVAEPSITISPRNVGLILGFYLKVTARITNTGAGPSLTPTDFGPANMLSRISFTDLENNERINTFGWHVAAMNSIKARHVYGGADINSSLAYPLGFGANYAVQNAPVMATATNGLWQFWYWIPLAYSESDYRGAIYANVINATMQLVLTFNPTPIAAAPANDLGYVATGTTGTMTAVQVDVHQVYMDQLPRGQNGGVVLPILDLATVYEYKSTTFTGLTPGTDFPMDYANFRDFLSTFAVYYDGANRLPAPGALLVNNVNYWLLQSANFTNIWKMPPDLIALRTRNHLFVDVPKGCYYFGSREKPISTIQYGNMQLVLNPSIAGPTASVIMAYEDFALKNAVTKAGSIQA